MKFLKCGQAKFFLVVATFLIIQFIVMDNYVKNVVMSPEEISQRADYALQFAENEAKKCFNDKAVNVVALREMGISLTLKRGDSVFYWCGSPYSEFRERSLKFSTNSDSTSTQIKIFLDNDFSEYNHYLFEMLSAPPIISIHENIGEKIDVSGQSFYIQDDVTLPLISQVIAFLGVVLLLLGFQLLLWCGLTSKNVFWRILYLIGIYLAVWAILHQHSAFGDSSVTSTLFIFMFTRALYLSRSKVKHQLNFSKSIYKWLFLVVYSFYSAFVVLYFYKTLLALADGGCFNEITLDNILEVNGNSLLFFFLFSVHVAIVTLLNFFSKLLFVGVALWRRFMIDILTFIAAIFIFGFEVTETIVGMLLCVVIVYVLFQRFTGRLINFVTIVLLMVIFLTLFTVGRSESLEGNFYEYLTLWSYLSIFVFCISGVLVVISGGKIFRYFDRKTINFKSRMVVCSVAIGAVLSVICVLLALLVWGDLQSVKTRAKREVLAANMWQLSRRGALYSMDGCEMICDNSGVLGERLPRELFEELSSGDDSCVYVEYNGHSLVCREDNGFYLVLVYDNSELSEVVGVICMVLNICVIILLAVLLVLPFALNYFVKPLDDLYLSMPKIDKLQRVCNFYCADNGLSCLVSQYNHLIDSLELSYMTIAKGKGGHDLNGVVREIVHEIRNPLTPIKLKIGMLELSRSTGGKFHEEHLRETLATLLEQIEVVERVLDKLSGAYINGGIVVEGTLILPILQNIRELYSQDDKVSVDLVLRCADDLRALVDRLDMMEVMTNLLKNSVEAMGEDGGQIKITLSSEAEKVYVVIEDSGGGIDDELLPYIFDENFSTKNRGSGIGLSICREIVESSGGEISAGNNFLGGARFTITLPRG